MAGISYCYYPWCDQDNAPFFHWFDEQHAAASKNQKTLWDGSISLWS